MTSRNKSVSPQIRHIDSPNWLVLVLVLATALRLTRLRANSLWFDETFSRLISHSFPAPYGHSALGVLPSPSGVTSSTAAGPTEDKPAPVSSVALAHNSLLNPCEAL